jgi:hypothetical protein
MRRKPALYEDEPDAPELTIGSYNSFQEVPDTDEATGKPQIGFIRQKSKPVKKKKLDKRKRV